MKKVFNTILFIIVILYSIGIIMYWPTRNIVEIQNIYNRVFPAEMINFLLKNYIYISVFCLITLFNKKLFIGFSLLYYLLFSVMTFLNYNVECTSCGNMGVFHEWDYKQEFIFFIIGSMSSFILVILDYIISNKK